MAAPKYLFRDAVTGRVMEVIATESGPAPDVIVATNSVTGRIDPSLLPITSTTGNFTQALIDFANPSGPEETTARVTVPAPWVVLGSIVLCNPAAIASPDHEPEDALVENLSAYATNLVPGFSFDIVAYAPRGTWGRYWINATGA